MPATPPSPAYAPNSDSSANSSPLLPFGQKQLPKVEEPSRNGSSSNGGAHSRTGGEQDAGPSRKRQRLDDDATQSFSASPAPSSSHQPHATSGGPSQPSAPPSFPLPHQLPLPPHSQSNYLANLAQHASTGASQGQPVRGVIMSSVFGITPRNEISREVGEWLLEICQGLPGEIEIEIKFGIITNKGSTERIFIPVRTETILNETRGLAVGFRSDMPLEAHRTLNRLLNEEVGKPAPHPPHSYHRLRYVHTKQIDFSYPANPANSPQLDPRFTQAFGFGKRRVSRNQVDNGVVAMVQKVKVGHLHVYCPMESFDYRISVNCEFPMSEMPADSERYENQRKKDRLSYPHHLFQIDLTQVKSINASGGGGEKVTHELELEILDARKFLSYGLADKQGQDRENKWEEAMDCVLNTVRLLNRNARPA